MSEDSSVTGEALGIVRLTMRLLSAEEAWTQTALAKTREGGLTVPGSKNPEPSSWCLVGALVEAEARLFGWGRTGDLYAIPELEECSERYVVAAGALASGCYEAVARTGLSAEYLVALGEMDGGTFGVPLHDAIVAFNDLSSVAHADVLAALAVSARLLRDRHASISRETARSLDANAHLTPVA